MKQGSSGGSDGGSEDGRQEGKTRRGEARAQGRKARRDFLSIKEIKLQLASVITCHQPRSHGLD